MLDSLVLHELQHARLPCPSLSPGVCSNSCPLSQWCHPTISSSVAPFSSCSQSFTASGSFPMSRLSASGGQSIGSLASTSVLPMNIQDWFPLGLTGLISCCPEDSQESSPTPQFKSVNFSVLSFLYGPALTSIHDYWRSHSFDYTDLCWQSDISAFNILSRFVIAFLPKSKHLLISWLQSLSVGGFEPKKIKSVIISTFSPSICHEVMEPDRSFLNDGFQGSCFTLFFHPYQGDPW